jgi:MurNAc alpha-1-phosphate uridylyltransferase
MRAMILAAGRGNRMRPLSLHTPKPLLSVAGKPLIVHHIESLKKAGVTEIMINLGYLGEKITASLMTGSQFGVALSYSYEDPILETGGGIAKVISWLGPAPFIVVSGDIFTQYPFAKLPKEPEGLAHLVLVDNPTHHLKGDYMLQEGKVLETGNTLLNFAGIGVYRAELFKNCPKICPLSLLFKEAFKSATITGEHYKGVWHNVGTPQQLKELNLK